MVADLLSQTLEEEKQTDLKLTEVTQKAIMPARRRSPARRKKAAAAVRAVAAKRRSFRCLYLGPEGPAWFSGLIA